jgi:hypothetical protein
MVPLDGDRTPQPVIQAPANQFQASLSPDGRWIAYDSIENVGLPTIYVQPVPPTGEKYQVTTTNTRAPLWSEDGRRLYFLELIGGGNRRRLMSVDVETRGGFSFGSPRPLFDGVDNAGGTWPYVVARGERWLALTRVADANGEGPPATEMRVTLNWFEELKQRVSAE